jgi:thioredoxin-related protein
LWTVAPWGHAAGLPPARNLAVEADLAHERGQPLLVMVSLHGCVYCERVRRSELIPRLQAGQPVVQVDMRSAQMLLDWQGRDVSHDDLVRRWKVGIAPTVLFFSRNGRELAERMEGAYSRDFYGAYLDERLDQSRQRLVSR